MKRFIARISVFLLGVIILLAIAEYCARICPNAYSQKEEWMEKNAPKVTTLVLGSSHAYAGIDASLLETDSHSAYNLSNSNQTQRYDWLLLAQDSTRLTSLSTVLYPTSSLLMDYSLESTPEWYRCIYYQLYNKIEVHKWYSRYNWETASLQTCCWKVQSLFLSGQADRMCDNYGRCTYYKSEAANRQNLTNVKLDERLEKYQLREAIRDSEEAYFDYIASYCQRHAIRLILFGSPVSSLYASSNQGQEYLQQMNLTAQQKAKLYSCIEYHDYSKDKRFDDQDFFDVDHLNDHGAQKLTTLIKDDCHL